MNSPDQVEKVYDCLFSEIERRSLKVEDLVQLATAAMEIIQKVKTMSGVEKKETVLAVIKKAIDSKMVPKNVRQICYDLLETALPKMIDLLVSAYRHEIDLKKVKEKCGCLPLRS